MESELLGDVHEACKSPSAKLLSEVLRVQLPAISRRPSEDPSLQDDGSGKAKVSPVTYDDKSYYLPRKEPHTVQHDDKNRDFPHETPGKQFDGHTLRDDKDVEPPNKAPGKQSEGQTTSGHTIIPREEAHSTGKKTVTFHDQMDNALLVGTSRNNGANVWVRVSRDYETDRISNRFYKDNGQSVSEAALHIVWRNEFRLSKYPRVGNTKDSERFQKRARYKHIYEIMAKHGRGSQTPEETSNDRKMASLGSQPSNLEGNKRRRSPGEKPEIRGNACEVILIDEDDAGDDDCLPTPPLKKVRRENSHSTTNPIASIPEPKLKTEDEVEFIIKKEKTLSHNPNPNTDRTSPNTTISPPIEKLSSQIIERTGLLVSASIQPDQGFAFVKLTSCTTLDQFFQTLIVECELTGRVASDLKNATARFPWNRAPYLMRKGRDLDWIRFCDLIRNSWEKDAGRFADDGYEIRVVAHVDP